MTSLSNCLRIQLWRVVNARCKLKPWKPDAESYVRECWAEDILLDQIFRNPSLWMAIRHRLMRAVLATLPDQPECRFCGGTGEVTYEAGGDTRIDQCGCSKAP